MNAVLQPEIIAMVRCKARSFKRRLPANIELDDLESEGLIAAWQAQEAFDGAGDLLGFVGSRVHFRMLNHLREQSPAKRGQPAVQFADNEAVSDHLPADDDQAQEIEDRETMDRQLHALSPSLRAVVIETLAGKSGLEIGAARGVSGSRVSQMVAAAVAECSSGKAARRTPESFDPAAVPLHRNVPVPPVHRPAKGKFQRLIDLMSPGDSRVLANSVANSLVSQMKRCGVRYCVRRVSDTTRQVWREPSAAQLAAGTTTCP